MDFLSGLLKIKYAKVLRTKNILKNIITNIYFYTEQLSNKII